MWISDLLAAAPQVKILITSREVLRLQEERVFRLRGLSYPLSDRPAEFEQSDAVQLFQERARRVRWGFSSSAERLGVARICRLVEGLPLALELAAAWTSSMSCTAIAEEIERNTGLLATQLRNVPERHRSLRAVFEQSWQMLTPAERGALRQLAVFHGGFSRPAAETVTGVTLATLAALCDKSLLRAEATGRFQCTNCCDSLPWNGWTIRATNHSGRVSGMAAITPISGPTASAPRWRPAAPGRGGNPRRTGKHSGQLAMGRRGAGVRGDPAGCLSLVRFLRSTGALP